MNKIKLYWTLQVGGWMAYALGQIVVFQTTSSRQIIFWLAEACIFLLFTHLFRNFIVRNRWLDYDMNKLIPRVLIAVFILSFVIYGTRLLVALPLNIEICWASLKLTVCAAFFKGYNRF